MEPQVIKDKNLKHLNTFGIDATARYYAEFEGVDDIRAILARPELSGVKWCVLSGGSNMLFCGNFDGLILHPISQHIEILEQADNHVLIEADAGVDWDAFVEYATSRGYAGIENLSAIPGYVGASPIQNIGAYGVEAKDSVDSVEVYLVESDSVVRLTNDECRFGYRDSIFKRSLKGRAIVLSVRYRLSLTPNFKLDYGDLRSVVEQLGGATLANVRAAVTQIRDSKLPNPKEIGNSGSFFKNPVVESQLADALKAKHPDMPIYPTGEGFKLAAGWLIDRAGWRGFREGDAGVHTKQALVLVNYGNATGGEILELAQRIREDIKQKFGVYIEMEVNTLC